MKNSVDPHQYPLCVLLAWADDLYKQKPVDPETITEEELRKSDLPAGVRGVFLKNQDVHLKISDVQNHELMLHLAPRTSNNITRLDVQRASFVNQNLMNRTVLGRDTPTRYPFPEKFTVDSRYLDRTGFHGWPIDDKVSDPIAHGYYGFKGV